MNLTLMRLISAGSWSVDLTTLLEFQGIARAIRQGAGFTFEKIDYPDSYLIDALAPNMAYDAQGSNQEQKLVAVHSVIGLMLKYDAECGPRGTKTIAKQIMQMDADPNVAAHVVVFDSGGGQSISVKPLKEAFSNATKPVIAYADDVMASAAYGAAVFADEIHASADARLGSIGVFIEINGYPKEHTHDDGFIKMRVYADSSPDKNNEYEEALKGNFKLLKDNLLNPLDAAFMEEVKQRRPKATDKQLAGGMFQASKVVGSMVDKIGTFEQTIQYAHTLGMKKQKNPNSNNTMKKTYAMIGAYAGIHEGIEVLEADGLHLDNSMADLVEAKIKETQQLLDTLQGQLSELAEGETVQSLKASIQSLTTERDEALANAQNTVAAETQAFKDQIASLQTDLQQANAVIAERDNTIATLEKTPEADQTGATSHGEGDGKEAAPADPTAAHYYRLSQIGKRKSL